MRYWGYHLMVNAGKCTPHSIRCPYIITDFTKKLVKDIDMVAYGNPHIVMFGTGNKKGYTLVQLIETSNICAHFVEETNDVYLDVFSCKEFAPETVTKVMNEFFGPRFFESTFVKRQAPNPYECLELK